MAVFICAESGDYYGASRCKLGLDDKKNNKNLKTPS